MPIHAQKAYRYQFRQFLRSRGFKTSCNDLSLRKNGHYFMAICNSGEKLL